MRFFLALFSLLILSSAQAQEDDVYEDVMNSNDTYQKKIHKIDSLLNVKLTNKEADYYSKTSKKYARWLYGKMEYLKATEVILLSIEHHSGEQIELQKKRANAGLYFFKNKDYQKSILHYQDVIAINNTNKRAGRAYTGIGRNYYYTGDYNLASKYYQTGAQLTLALNDTKSFLNNVISSSNTYMKIGSSNSLKTLYENLMLVDSYTKDPEYKKKEVKLNTIRARYYTHYKIKDTAQEKGILLLDKIIAKAIQKKDSLTLYNSYSDVGILLNKVNIPKSTQSFFKSLKYCPSGLYKLTINNFGNIAINNAKLKKFDVAIDYLTKATAIATGIQNSIFEIDIASFQNLENLEYGTWIILQATAEMQLLKYESTKNIKDLEKSLLFFEYTDQLFDYYTRNSTELGSKLKWRKKASKMYSRALKACYLAQDVEKANFFMEKNKALLLASEIEKQQNKQSAAFPKEVLEQELLLKKKVITLEKEQKKKLKDVTISQEILLVKQRIKLFQDSIKVIFPNYVIAKKTSIISIGDIQKRLKDYEVNIQFHISEDDEYGVYSNADNGYILITTPTKVVFEEIKNLQKLKENTTKLSKTLKVPFKSEADIEAYTEISLAIYNQLFISEEIKTLLHSKKAIIIPDNYISFIPFEALMTSNEPNSYLIKQTEISYSYSNSFQVNSSKSKIRESKILGMAPIDFKPLHLPKLVYSEHEINNIKKYFKGDFYTGTTATKQQFLDASTTHNILHLATHADARDGTSPWIAFSDTKLELEDLYVTSNDASLVFLSGCNTTLGEQATGEGVMSLARGFFYAGSQSVISTLWRIDDKSTAEIAGYFYQNISEGQTKSKALHRAKLRYLDKHSLSDISPHYWASYILLGENNSINTSSSLFLKISIISCLLLLFAIFIQRNKKVKNSF